MKPATAALCAVLLFSSLWAEVPFAKAAPPDLTKDGRHWVEQTLKKLSLEEKVGQMFSVRYFNDFQNFTSDSYRQFREQLQKYHIGSVVLTDHLDGPVLLKNPPLEVAMMANQLQRDSALPLLIAADFERGIFTRVSPAPAFPDAMAFGAAGNPEYAERFGAITAEESRALGIHWNFFPVADVNSNPNNPIINTRSFGEDPDAVGDLVAAYIKGARAHGMLTTAKHFPGHGDTDTDTHLAVARVGGDAARLHDVELKPFEKAISAGVDSVMIAHVSVPALDPDPNKVATVSPAVVNGVLRHQLGFKNVIVTDAMEMRGLTSLYPPEKGNASGRAAVDAVKAGNDVILLPSDLAGAFQGIVEAVRHGEIPESRIDESVRRILEMKASLGLHKARLVDLEQVPYLVNKPEDLQFAQQVADDAITLVRDNGKVLPLTPLRAQKTEAEYFQAQVKPAVHVVAIIMTDSVRGPWGRGFELALKARRADATVFYVDNTVATALSAPIFQAVKDAEKVVIAAYASPVAGKQVMVNGKLVNTVGLEQASGQLLMQVLDLAADKTVLVALGSPYLAQSYGAVQNYLCTYSNATSSELSAVKVLFSELTPRGKLPVTLPGIAQRGFSLAPRSQSAPSPQR
ncbi:MAG TPA: glycoside hydrolase family 3 protein [Candidatus Angelobacter sp.]|nr:glycoside hydrolase family 3 protein [Candidatus Angelobacter sp.]